MFVVGIFCDSEAAQSANACSKEYVQAAIEELNYLAGRMKDSGLCTDLRILLVYVPLANKAGFVTDFDQRLKGLQ